MAFKKIILSGFLIITYGFYVNFQRNGLPATIESPPAQIDNKAPVYVLPPIPSDEEGFGEDDGPVIPQTVPAPSPEPSPTQTPAPNPAPAPNPVPTPAPVAKPTTPPPIVKPRGVYTDGSFKGSVADAYYGYVQVLVVIQNGKITDVQFLDHPQHRNTSVMINNYAMPILRQEAIRAQSARVNIVSGATFTSVAYQESLAAALAQAKN